MRPCPEQTAVMVMIFWKIIGEHFAIKSVKRVNVSAAISIRRDARAADDSVVVYEYRSLTFKKTERTGIGKVGSANAPTGIPTTSGLPSIT